MCRFAHGTQGLNPLIFISFDQKIDPQAIVATVGLEANGTTFAARIASSEEIAGDEVVKGLVEAAEKRDNGTRWIVVTPKQSLPKDSLVIVSVGKGTPSAEGPRLTTSNQSFTFRTYGPLKIVRSRCGWDCRPGTPFSFEFSNSLEEEGFESSSLKFEPALEKVRAQVHNRWMTIRGRTAGQTTYTVTIPGTLKDEFGQTLGQDETRTFIVGDAHPRLTGANVLAVADPKSENASFDVYSINIPSLDVKIYKAKVEDWEKHLLFTQGNPRRPKPAPGRKVFDGKIKPEGDTDRMVTTAIELSRAMNKDGKGHAVVVVTPTKWPNDYKPEIKTWVQVTDIGLDAFVDYESMLAWTTDLATGKSLEGVEVSISHTDYRVNSNSEGLATIALKNNLSAEGEHQLVVAKKGSDVAFMPQTTSAWQSSSAFTARGTFDALRWFSFDDREMYKPGETVRVKGWLRIAEGGKKGGLVGLDGNASMSYTVMGPRGNKIGEGKAEVSRVGGFDLSFELPKTPNLGRAYVSLSVSGTRGTGTIHNHSFQIQEFRRPE
ncbi:MAG: hypothetical protein JKY56_16930, partial [Kofleriaceae bacterium]|nr:hypothetical protein [Kofleriaceae bacterium]